MQVERALLHALEKHVNLAAAGKTNRPGLIVADAEMKPAYLAVPNRLCRGFDRGALHAAAGNGAEKRAVVADRHVTARRAGSRAPGFHHRRQHHATSFGNPRFNGVQQFFFIGHRSAFLRADATARFAITGTRCARYSAEACRSPLRFPAETEIPAIASG